jgi:hypothetical protein
MVPSESLVVVRGPCRFVARALSQSGPDAFWMPDPGLVRPRPERRGRSPSPAGTATGRRSPGASLCDLAGPRRPAAASRLSGPGVHSDLRCGQDPSRRRSAVLVRQGRPSRHFLTRSVSSFRGAARAASPATSCRCRAGLAQGRADRRAPRLVLRLSTILTFPRGQLGGKFFKPLIAKRILITHGSCFSIGWSRGVGSREVCLARGGAGVCVRLAAGRRELVRQHIRA